MKARKLRVEAKPGKVIPQFKLVPHPPDKVKPVVADHSLPSSRDSSAQRTDPTPGRNPARSVNPSPPNPARVLSTRPEDLISQYASPQFVVQRGRKWNPNPVQPRQKPARATTSDPVAVEAPPQPESDLSALSSLATEMKKMFEFMPQLMTAPRDRRKLSKSVQYDNPPDLNTSLRSRIMKKRLSSHNVHAEAAAVYQNNSFETPTALSTHRGQRIRRQRKTESIGPGVRKLSSTKGGNSTVRSKSSDVESLPHLQEKPKVTANLEDLQKYFLDFHQKSRDLLGKLERSVLGK